MFNTHIWNCYLWITNSTLYPIIISEIEFLPSLRIQNFLPLIIKNFFNNKYISSSNKTKIYKFKNRWSLLYKIFSIKRYTYNNPKREEKENFKSYQSHLSHPPKHSLSTQENHPKNPEAKRRENRPREEPCRNPVGSSRFCRLVRDEESGLWATTIRC